MDAERHILDRFEQLVSDGEAILARCNWDGYDYHNKIPGNVEYLQFRTEALNIVRRACGESSDHYRELQRLATGKDTSTNSYYLHQCLGVVKAAQRDFQGGYLLDLKSLVAAEVLGDFLDQAEHLHEQGYHVPAASLAGAVLEDGLRKMCEAKSITVPSKTTIDKLNSDLAKAGVYNKLVQKRITALADIRNNADHGRFDQFKPEDVEDMIAWVKRFCADQLA